MSDEAQHRIWITALGYDTEYIRADLHASLAKRLEEVEAGSAAYQSMWRQAEGDVTALRAENERLARHIVELDEERCGLIDENEALRKDAERYRYLTANSFDKSIRQFHVWNHWYEPHSKTGEPTEWKVRERGATNINRAIDAAIAAEKP